MVCYLNISEPGRYELSVSSQLFTSIEAELLLDDRVVRFSSGKTLSEYEVSLHWNVTYLCHHDITM